MCHACYHGQLTVVKFFVEEVKVSLEAEVGKQALRYACSGKGDNLHIIKYLFENGVDIRGDYNHALSWAAFKGSLAVVEFLVENGCDINEHDIGPSPIEEAARKGFLSIVQYLYEKGAQDAFLALKTASRNRKEDVVAYLSEKGVGINVAA